MVLESVAGGLLRVAAYGGGVGGVCGEGVLVETGGYVGEGYGRPCGACGRVLTSQGLAQRENHAGLMWFAGCGGTGGVEASCAVAVCDGLHFPHLHLPCLHDRLCQCQLLLGCWSWRGNALAYPEMKPSSGLLGSGLVDLHAHNGTLTPGTEVVAVAERPETESPLLRHLQFLNLLVPSWPVDSLSVAAVAAGRSAGPPSCYEWCERGQTEEGELAEIAGIDLGGSPSVTDWTEIGVAGQGSFASKVFLLGRVASSVPYGSERASAGVNAGHAESVVHVMCDEHAGCAGEAGGSKGRPDCSGPLSPGSHVDEDESRGDESVATSLHFPGPR